MRRAAVAAALSVALIAGSSAKASIVTWQASSGITPDNISPPWALVDTADPETPVLAGGVLTLSTSHTSESMYYIQNGPSIDTSKAFFIEAQLKYVSGLSTQSYRAPIHIGFTVAQNVGTALFIGEDEIFLATSNTGVSSKIPVLTTDDFHTIRIEYDGAGGVEVFHDGDSKLTGSTFNSASFNGPQQRIYWGELSSHTYGTSEWTSFVHNASAVPEPGSALALGFGLCGWFGYRSRRRSAA